MFTVRSTHFFPHKSLSHHLSLSFSFLPTKPTLLTPFFHQNPKPRMSNNTPSRPSAFDAMMSNARAAAKKKPKPPSPTKRKTPDSNLSKNPSSPKTPNSISSKHPPNPQLEKPKKDKPIPDDSQTQNSNPEAKLPNSKPEAKNPNLKDSQNPGSNPIEEGIVGKKQKTMSVDERINELKKKPSSFNPKIAAYWDEGKRVPFLFVVRAFDMISKESGRILITDIACNMLRTVWEAAPVDLIAVVYLAANKIAPAHEGLELGIGDASIIKALAEACGSKEENIKKEYKELGDLGLVAHACRSSQARMYKPPELTVTKVFDTLRLIAKESGKNSQEKKKNHIKNLLVAAIDCEPQYLIRLFQTKLRIGLAEQTLLAALGQAAVYAEKLPRPPSQIQSPLEEAAKIVKQVYSVLPVYDKIIPALLSDGVWNLTKTCNFTLGVPVGPMLAKPTKGVSEILDKFQDMEFTCEYKYDGERAQIHHMEDGSVEIYSRNAERNTGKFPDVALALSRLKKSGVKSFVLDCEIVAYDREKNKILPFQILSTRARKNVTLSEIKVDVCIFAFDILYHNGQPLIQEQLNVRREHLYNSFEEEPGFFQFATAKTSNDLEEIQKFLEAAVDTSSEGLIIKTLNKDATYEPSKRSNNWLKLKKDYMDTIGDSLDLVPIAGFQGRGKRTGYYGAFLLACYDNNNEEFQSICKIGTGFSEVQLEERSASLRSKVIPNPKQYYRYADTLKPDVWFEPAEVWEVKAADLTISPVYRAAIGTVDSKKGISLRFPRLIRVREDKNPEQASSSEQVAEMYNAQKFNHRNNQDEDEDD